MKTWLTSVAALFIVVTTQDPKVLQISFAAATQLSLFEPVVVRFGLSNGTAKAITLDLGDDFVTNFRFEVVRPDGTVARLAPRPEASMSQVALGGLRLQAGQSYSQRLLLNEWVSIDQVGNYTAKLSFVGSATPATAAVGSRTTTLEFDILKRDPERLNAVCEQLFGQALQRKVAEAQFGTTALSYVRDPVALPYLERLVRQGNDKGIAIRGISRVGTPEARRVLEELAKDGDPEISAVAKSVLAQFGRGPVG